MKGRSLGLVLGLLLTGCGLPMAAGVREPGAVPAEELARDDVQVLPPGPRADASPEAVVRGFLSAESSSERRHATAREFLTPELHDAWHDDSSAAVYDPQSEQVSLVPGTSDLVRFTAPVLGEIAEDGSYTALTPVVRSETYHLRRVDGQWRLSGVPDGLRLTPGDRERSFRPANAYFLAPTYDGSPPTHVVADALQLPVLADPAEALVERLLAGPSAALDDSAVSAFPPDTTLVRPVTTSASGVVVVDLSSRVAALSDLARAQLSAQLVWTLRGLGTRFTSLRLRVEGQPLQVSGTAEDQRRDAWAVYAPDGLTGAAPAFTLVDGRPRRLDLGTPDVPDSPALADPGGPVSSYALSRPDGARLAVLVAQRDGALQLKTGPAAGPLSTTSLAPSSRLASPSWGSGELGVWLLRSGPDPALLLVDAQGRATDVPVEGGLARLGALRTLRLSRDGTRLALLAGGRLWVGRVAPVDGRPAVKGLRVVTPALTRVTDVSWLTGTSLVALGRLAPIGAPVPVRLSVDGAAVTALSRLGLQGDPLSVAVADGRPLLVESRVDGALRTSLDNGRFFEQMPGSGRTPTYPG